MADKNNNITSEEKITEMKGKNKNGRKPFYKIVIFMLIICVVFIYLNKVFTISASDSNKQIFNALYAEENDTIDVMYFGTSASNRYFIAPKAYNDTGVASFTLATMGMPMFFVSNLVEEVEKTQSPKLYIVELRWFLKEKEQLTDAHIRRVTDSMKFSSNRNDAIKKGLSFTKNVENNDIDDEKLSYYIPLIKYHSRLETGDMKPYEFFLYNRKNMTKGYVTSSKTLERVPQKQPVYSDEKACMSPESEKTLTDMLDYFDKHNKQVLFVLSPYSMKEGQNEVFNTAIEMVENRGYTVLNFNTEEMAQKLGLNWNKDFYNSKHVNFIGAEKYTDYLSQYIKKHYHLKDHRGEKKYQSYDDSYEYYKNFIKEGIQQ